MYVIDRGVIQRSLKITVQKIDQMAWRKGGTSVTKHGMGQNLEAERRTESSGKASSRSAGGSHYGIMAGGLIGSRGLGQRPRNCDLNSPVGGQC